MIFVTLGSQKFQFNRLLKKIDKLIEDKLISDDVFAQIGTSDYIPKNYYYKDFLDREEFSKRIKECDILITHGGTGVIVGAIKQGKKVIAIPRLMEFGEHVDNHQLQIIQQFNELNLICPCYELDKLNEKIDNIYNKQYKIYESNTQKIIDDIDSFLFELI